MNMSFAIKRKKQTKMNQRELENYHVKILRFKHSFVSEARTE